MRSFCPVAAPPNVAPTRTLSYTLSVAKVWGTWNVLASPRRQIWWDFSGVMSRPRKRMRPPEGGNVPAITWNRVDLPAPLGPAMPKISPSATCRSTPSNACSLPNTLVTDSVSRIKPRSPVSSAVALGKRSGGRPDPEGPRRPAGYFTQGGTWYVPPSLNRAGRILTFFPSWIWNQTRGM